MGLQSPLSRVKGLGSAREGAHHWWWQRLTAVALVPLCLWFSFGIASLTGADFNTVKEWMSGPWTAGMTIILLIMLFHHAQLGLQVVVEDYVHLESLKIATIVLIKFVCFTLGLVSVLAVIRIQML